MLSAPIKHVSSARNMAQTARSASTKRRVWSFLSPAFTPRALRELEPNMITLVEKLLDAASNKGDVDLIADYAAAIPVDVVGNMLGVPHADRKPLRD